MCGEVKNSKQSLKRGWETVCVMRNLVRVEEFYIFRVLT